MLRCSLSGLPDLHSRSTPDSFTERYPEALRRSVSLFPFKVIPMQQNRRIAKFEECLGEFAVKYGGFRVREAGYSHLLFSHLRQEYGNIFMTGIGIDRSHLEPKTGDRGTALINKYLRKSMDLYPDLVAFQRGILELELDELSRLDRLPKSAIPWMMCEWKFTSSFRNMQRGHILKDAVKLQLLSEFLKSSFGDSPALLQVVFNFPGSDYKFTAERIRNWFSENSLQSAIPDVRSIMVTPDGKTELLTSWSTPPFGQSGDYADSVNQ